VEGSLRAVVLCSAQDRRGRIRAQRGYRDAGGGRGEGKRASRSGGLWLGWGKGKTEVLDADVGMLLRL